MQPNYAYYNIIIYIHNCFTSHLDEFTAVISRKAAYLRVTPPSPLTTTAQYVMESPRHSSQGSDLTYRVTFPPAIQAHVKGELEKLTKILVSLSHTFQRNSSSTPPPLTIRDNLIRLKRQLPVILCHARVQRPHPSVIKAHKH